MSVNYMELFSQLQADSGQHEDLDPDRLVEGLNRLHNIGSLSEADDHRLGKPRGKVKVVGDPEIVDREGNYYHYLGPALVVTFDHHGVVRTLEFVGVEGGKENANYIKEVWQFNIKTLTWKYRDLRAMQGVPAHRIRCEDRPAYYASGWESQGDTEFHVGLDDWQSEKPPGSRPPAAFLGKFKPSSKTFLVNLRAGTFIRGPKYGLLEKVIQDPKPFVEALIAADFPPEEWMQDAAASCRVEKTTREKQPPAPTTEQQAVQVAQVALGIVAVHWASVPRSLRLLLSLPVRVSHRAVPARFKGGSQQFNLARS